LYPGDDLFSINWDEVDFDEGENIFEIPTKQNLNAVINQE
jgi:hypothetical protein